MKKCPYCAEEIQDEAIKCRYCYSDLTVEKEEALQQRPEPSSPPTPTTPTATAAVASSGSTSTPWGEREETATPEPTPEREEPSAVPTDAGGLSDSSVRYSHSGYRYVLGYGPDHFGIWDRQSPSEPAETFPRTDEGWRSAWLRFVALEPKHVEVPQEGSPAATPAAAAPGEGDSDAVTYTHTGTRYLLGYGASFFGIWDRQNPASPVERFSRTDDGWAQAWRRYTQIEQNFTEVAKD